jgi:phage protein|nr:MAG TPA: nucelotide kinase [Caudoviricetes sp.]
MNDNVNKPSHYISESGIEALDVIDAFKPCPEYKAGFFWGNVVKYVLRFHKKNGIEDLKKAEFYLKRLIEELEYGSRK